jgi:2-keto-3-deoxy-6-phosphogluconate aldolase
MNIRDIMMRSPVIPVLTIDQPTDAGALAQALVRGGLRVLEVTLPKKHPARVAQSRNGGSRTQLQPDSDWSPSEKRD